MITKLCFHANLSRLFSTSTKEPYWMLENEHNLLALHHCSNGHISGSVFFLHNNAILFFEIQRSQDFRNHCVNGHISGSTRDPFTVLPAFSGISPKPLCSFYLRSHMPGISACPPLHNFHLFLVLSRLGDNTADLIISFPDNESLSLDRWSSVQQRTQSALESRSSSVT